MERVDWTRGNAASLNNTPVPLIIIRSETRAFWWAFWQRISRLTVVDFIVSWKWIGWRKAASCIWLAFHVRDGNVLRSCRRGLYALLRTELFGERDNNREYSFENLVKKIPRKFILIYQLFSFNVSGKETIFRDFLMEFFKIELFIACVF